MKKRLADKFNIDRFQEGDLRAFNHVFNQYYEAICIFAINLVTDKQEAEDITVEGFVKLWRLRKNFESLENIKAFLYVTARNASIDYLRHTQVERNAHKELLHVLDAEYDFRNETINALVLSEIYEKIEDLPTKCKGIIKLIYFQNLSTAEIAQELNITKQTVLNQKAIAIKKLKSALLKKF